MTASRVMTLVSLLVVSCDSLNIVQTAQATADFSVLVEAVVKANLTTTLSGTGPFTVFAPTNAAFTAALTALSIDKSALLARSDLADILKYHVISGKIMAADLTASQTPTTVQGLKVIVAKSSSGVTFGGAKVTTADIACDNGVIHIIDAVVLPPSMNIVQTAQATADFSVLVEAVVKANLATTLSGTGPFTVFAPTNAAFTAALTALSINKTALLARSDLADILKYHVISGKIMAADLTASQTPTTVQGLKVIVAKTSSGVTFGGAKVTTADIACSNGVIHMIDAVVLPPSMNIVQTAQATPDFSVLVEAVVKANLATPLSGTGPFTVFAPNNAAFTAALTALSINKSALLDRSDLADILKYHVINGKIMAADLLASQTPATLGGTKVIVAKTTTGVTYGSAKVTTADIACSNGVIHMIDAVVLPPSMNIVQTAQATSDFSVLVEAVVKANLATPLSGTGPFTVFAPTNAAFTAALTALSINKSALLNRSDLADILKYHVVSGKIMAADLQASQTPATLGGKNVTVVKTASPSDSSATVVKYGSATVTTADIACKNGVIHAIDKVVFPPEAATEPPIQASSLAASKSVAASVVVSVAMMVFCLKP